MKSKIFTGTATEVEKKLNAFISSQANFEIHSTNVSTSDKNVVVLMVYVGDIIDVAKEE